MSSNQRAAIRVEGVSKSFKTFRRSLDRLGHLMFPGQSKVGTSNVNEFVALDNVSFQVEPGKAFGVMGQNGSGKSTLLQIVSGIMAPSVGSVTVKGNIAALLELGSGFSPDFTGLENIYLNASVLGLSKAEIEDKLDAIIDFADIGVHIDLPVKTYSSGMMLRLAFAVQVAIEPDILIIDEALAVGDAKFQLKCFRRLTELKARGTTILFVSHATELVKSFCDFALVLHKGKMIYQGDAKVATIKYLGTLFPDQGGKTAPKTNGTLSTALVAGSGETSLVVDTTALDTATFGIGGANLTALSIEGVDRPNILVGGQTISVFASFCWDTAAVRHLLESEPYEPNITLGISFSNEKGMYLFGCNGFDKGIKIDCLATDSASLQFSFALPHLVEGDYFISVAIALGDQARHVQMKWYDCIIPIRCATRDKVVHGLFGIDFSLALMDKAAT